MYDVQVIAPDGKQLASEELYGKPWGTCKSMPTKAWALAIAPRRRGRATSRARPTSDPFGEYKEILIVRPDGSRTTIGLSSAAILKRELYISVYGGASPQVGFGRIRLADDGTSVATIVAHYGDAMDPSVSDQITLPRRSSRSGEHDRSVAPKD
jgi:hypothetical protein